MSEEARVVERLRLIDGGKTLELTATVEDPTYYAKPWTARTTLQRRPGMERMEFTCGYGVYETRYTK